MTFAYNEYQQQFRVLARGIVEWLTQGVHLGQARNYFAVHVDDVFAPDARWDTERNCTPGDVDCVGGDGEEAHADPDDRRGRGPRRRSGSRQRDFTLDMVYNAGAGEEWKSENGGTDALADRLLADKAQYRWINHTYTHPFLGCVQDTSTVPWSCAKNADGSTRYMSRADISARSRNNHDWGVDQGAPAGPHGTRDRRALGSEDPAAAARRQPQPGRCPRRQRRQVDSPRTTPVSPPSVRSAPPGPCPGTR